MGNPFAPPSTPLNPITERQLDFLCSLKRQLLEIENHDGDTLPVMDAFELEARSWGRAQASGEIDNLKEAIQAARLRVKDRDPEAIEDIDGFWELPDGRICKVQLAVHGSGNPYAKLLNTETGSFDYASGLISEVRRTGTRLPLERAQALGKLYGRCICCGRTLTDEFSIENGIGPICIKKF